MEKTAIHVHAEKVSSGLEYKQIIVRTFPVTGHREESQNLCEPQNKRACS